MSQENDHNQENKYSLIDIETTGGSSGTNKIIEIAIINLDHDQIVDQYSTLINPERSIPPFIQSLTGISTEMVHDAPKFYEVAKTIVEFTEGRIFVAHNVFFDFNFIKHEFSELGFQFQRELLCTVRLSRRVFPGLKSYSLGKLTQSLGIPLNNAHRAIGDALATAQVFQKIIASKLNLQQETIKKRKLNLPNQLSPEVIENLPQKPGVYYFFDQHKKLLYVGKSIDIKKRVSHHFRPDMKRPKDIQLKNMVAFIEYKVLGNELASLLFEAQEIKQLAPPFNVALKGQSFPYGLYLEKDEMGINQLNVKKSNEECYLRFRSKVRAKNKRNKIYESVLGVEYDSIHFTSRLEQFLQKFSQTILNQMVEKIYYHKKPKQENFQVKLPGRESKEECLIKVDQLHPTQISYYHHSKKAQESITLIPDQDFKSITIEYLNKNKPRIETSRSTL